MTAQTIPSLFHVRRLPVVPVLTTLVVAVALSMAANYWLFGSEFLNGILRRGGGWLSGTWLANLGLLLVVVLVCLCWWAGARGPELGLRRRDFWPAMIVTLVIWLLLNATTVLVVQLSGQSLLLATSFSSAAALRSSAAELVGQLFGNALYEEILFRGVLLIQFAVWLRKAPEPPNRLVLGLSLLMSQGIFALQHIPNRLAFHAWQSVGDAASDLALLFVSGVFFAAVFLRTRNLWIAVGVHTLGNLPTTLVAGPEWVHPVVMLVATLALIACGRRLPGNRLKLPLASSWDVR